MISRVSFGQRNPIADAPASGEKYEEFYKRLVDQKSKRKQKLEDLKK